jgi:hypothetical protein
MKPAFWKPWRMDWAAWVRSVGVPLRKREKSTSYGRGFSTYLHYRTRDSTYRDKEVVAINSARLWGHLAMWVSSKDRYGDFSGLKRLRKTPLDIQANIS